MTPPETVTAPARPPAEALKERFAKANATGDGRLTPEQAKSGMPMVARNFAAIDASKKGYVTLEDIQAYRHEHPRKRPVGAARKARRRAAAAKA